MLLHFQKKQFEEWWKRHLKEIDGENNGLRISSKEIKAYCQKAYEQGQFDERNYIVACMRDTMRDFTPEVKELIINTPITRKCFDVDFEELCELHKEEWDRAIEFLEEKRRGLIDKRLSEKNREIGFCSLVRLLPSSYKVVKL